MLDGYTTRKSPVSFPKNQKRCKIGDRHTYINKMLPDIKIDITGNKRKPLTSKGYTTKLQCSCIRVTFRYKK